MTLFVTNTRVEESFATMPVLGLTLLTTYKLNVDKQTTLKH